MDRRLRTQGVVSPHASPGAFSTPAHTIMLGSTRTHMHARVPQQALQAAGARLRDLEASEAEAQERIQELIQEIKAASESAALSLQVCAVRPVSSAACAPRHACHVPP